MLMCYEWIFTPLQKQEHKYKNCQSDLMNVLCVSIPAFIVINTKPFLTHTGPRPTRHGLFVGEEAEKQQSGGNHNQHPLWRVGAQG